jgi:DNA-binding NtrC family response regulator
MRKVFLVDDDPMLLDMLKDHLEKNMNVTITAFSKGEDCLRNIEHQPDLVVLDYNLSGVDKTARNGIEILKEIKSKFPKMHVVILSGQDKIDVAVETMKHGAYDYVVKNETSFKRTENAALNVFRALKLAEVARAYKFGFWVLALGISIIIALSVILDAIGATDIYAFTL